MVMDLSSVVGPVVGSLVGGLIVYVIARREEASRRSEAERVVDRENADRYAEYQRILDAHSEKHSETDRRLAGLEAEVVGLRRVLHEVNGNVQRILGILEGRPRPS